ncbi:hypothetical protein AAFC00_003093 [Neodothiora populina]
MRISVSAESPLDKYPAKQHAARVATVLGVDHGLIYLPGETISNYADSDQPRPFRQSRYFLYLSGVDESDCHLTYDIATENLTLWLPPIDPKVVVWVGRGSTTSEALEKYDIDNARYSPHLKHYLESWASSNKHKSGGDIFVLHPADKKSRVPESLSSRLNTTALQPATDTCRVIKDPHEIDLIRTAAGISTKAHESVLRNLLTFKSEAQVTAHFLDVSIAHGAKHQSYGIIAGSGSNAAILHYENNDAVFGDSQLMCLDAGAEWQSYSSDITRTFPLSGNWPSKESKEIYNLVQLMQSSCTTNLKPGKNFVENQYLAHVIAIEGLLKLGILRDGSIEEIYKAGTSRAFFPHGLGHHMGLEVHDVSPPSVSPFRSSSTSREQGREIPIEIRHHFTTAGAESAYHASSQQYADPDICRSPCRTYDSGLQPGMVITVEPGIYFNGYALEEIYYPSPVHSKYIDKKVVKRYMPVGGVRIEDDILITPSGYELMSHTAKGEDALRIIRGESVVVLQHLQV